MALATLGVCNYNGIEFPSSVQTTEFRGTPVYSSDGRTITHTVFSLTLKAIFANAAGTAAAIKLAIARLTAPAAPLRYTGRGFGDVSINAGNLQDVAWGPKPKVISLTPLGGPGIAVELVWQVEWSVPTCGDAVTKNFPMEFTYSLTYDIDQAGYTQRNYSGKIVIPQTRLQKTNRIPYTSADEWRERIASATIDGFRRTSQNFNLSEDRRTLTFSIVDTQLPPWAPPAGCIEAEASHTYTSEAGKIFFWNGVVEASYQLARGVSVAVAVQAFFALLKDRIGFVRGNIRDTNGKIGGVAILPIQFSMTEKNLYGKVETSFRCAYRVSGPNLSEILRAGGMWRPLPRAASASYAEWGASVAIAQSPRGYADLKFTPGTDDKIIDLCLAQPNPNVSENPSPPPGVPGAWGAQQILENTFPPPTPDGSWLLYEAAISTESDSGNVEAKPLPGNVPQRPGSTPSPWGAVEGQMPSAYTVTQVTYGPEPDATGTDVQDRTEPTIYLRLIGRALRALFPIPVPEITEINGVKPTLISRVDRGEGFTQGIVGNMLYPIYSATFNLRYVLNVVPTQAGSLEVVPNPVVAGDYKFGGGVGGVGKSGSVKPGVSTNVSYKKGGGPPPNAFKPKPKLSQEEVEGGFVYGNNP